MGVNLRSQGTIVGNISPQKTVVGNITDAKTIYATLMETFLKGDKGDPGDTVELRVDGDILQYRYIGQDEWMDIVDLRINDYENLRNVPIINGVEMRGDVTNLIMTPLEELSNTEIMNMMKGGD